VPYAQRTTELAAIDTGIAKDVKTYIIMSPVIYGFGTGLKCVSTLGIPRWMKTAVIEGQPIVVRDSGDNTWDYMHIADLPPLYEIILEKAIAGEDIPYGAKGIYFSGTGRYTWGELAARIGKAGYELGALQSAEPKEVTLEYAAEKLDLPPQLMEIGFTSKYVVSHFIFVELNQILTSV
jgi:nucleoside-diphosphate-sugar epimerase